MAANKCASCGFDNKIGALMCEACGDPLEVNVGTSAPVSATAPAPVAAVSSGLQVLRLIEGLKTAKVKEVDIPKDDFEFLLGRTDLDQGIIPDVDLAKFADKVTVEGKTGYTISRKQAMLKRKMGKLSLKVIGNAPVTHLPKGGAWKNIQLNEEVTLGTGDRIRLGGEEGYVIFELTEAAP